MNCHWKYGKIILFHLLKQALGVSELTGLRYQTHWARHCWSLTSINVMATDCLYLLHTLIKPKAEGAPCVSLTSPAGTPPIPSQMFPAEFACWRCSVLQTQRSKVPPRQPPASIPRSACALNYQRHCASSFSLKSATNDELKTQNPGRWWKGVLRSKVLPEGLDLRAIINSMSVLLWQQHCHPCWPSEWAWSCLLGAASLSQPSAHGSTGLLLQVAC